MSLRRLNLPWRQPEIEPGPIQLSSRRLYILPTRAGLAFLALLLGLLLASTNYSISLGYLFTFLLASMGTTGLFHSHRNLLGISLQPLPISPVYAGESARIRMRLDNPDARLRGALILKRGQASSSEADLTGNSGTEFELRLTQPERGYHHIESFTLASTWPLGLFRCWSVFALDWGVLVYPRPATDPLPFPVSTGQGQGTAAERAGDDEFSSLRNYRPGDPPSRIAWKSMARGRPPLTKQFADIQGRTLWLDWDSAPETDSEARLSRLARWVLDAERAGLSWGLRIPGRSLPPGHGEAHFKQGLEALARYGET
jgi:uncharacterized protein (DUF58 family)